MTPEAKAEARALGFDDTQSTLLKAAKAPGKEGQIRALREEAARKAARRDNATSSETRIEAAKVAVRRLSHDELAGFIEWFDAFCAERRQRESSDATLKASDLPGWTMRI